MDGQCREAIRPDRPFERSTNRSRDRHEGRSSERLAERVTDRRQFRSSDRSANRIPEKGRNRSCDRILDGRPNQVLNGNICMNDEIYSTKEKIYGERREKGKIYQDPKYIRQTSKHVYINKTRDSPNVEQRVNDEYSDESGDEDQDGEEVCIWVDDRQLWVSGVHEGTTCGELVRALLPHQRTRSRIRTSENDWVITEMWRSMEQPLDNEATILDIWNAWGDAQNEIKFNLRYVDSSGDSGRGSPPSPRPSRRRPSKHYQRRQLFPDLIKAQGATLQKQADRLREQDLQISLLEEQTHRTRMAKHGPNYVLESYLRDIAKHNELFNTEDRRDDFLEDGKEATKEKPDGQDIATALQSREENHNRSSEATDSPAANSDSGVGVSRSPPRQTKKRSRGKLLLREHYLTKELTDICQINANRIQTKPDDNSETSSDELCRIQQQIDMLEKLAIVNKRLQREEELIVRLGVKLRRYLCEDQISFIESEEQIATMLNTIRQQMEESSKEIESTAIEIERTDYQLEKRKNLLDILSKEIDEVEKESEFLEVQANQIDFHTSEHHQTQMVNNVQYIGTQNCDQTRIYTLPLDISNQIVNVSYGSHVTYPLDTLV